MKSEVVPRDWLVEFLSREDVSRPRMITAGAITVASAAPMVIPWSAWRSPAGGDIIFTHFLVLWEEDQL